MKHPIRILSLSIIRNPIAYSFKQLSLKIDNEAARRDCMNLAVCAYLEGDCFTFGKELSGVAFILEGWLIRTEGRTNATTV